MPINPPGGTDVTAEPNDYDPPFPFLSSTMMLAAGAAGGWWLASRVGIQTGAGEGVFIIVGALAGVSLALFMHGLRKMMRDHKADQDVEYGILHVPTSQELASPSRLLVRNLDLLPQSALPQETLGEIVGWCSSNDVAAIGLFVGEVGTGRSELFAEICRRLRAMGWSAEVATRPGVTDGRWWDAWTEAVDGGNADRLLVIPDGEMCADILSALLQNMGGKRPGEASQAAEHRGDHAQSRLRIAVIAVRERLWWASISEQALAAGFSVATTRTLPPLAATPAIRDELFRQSAETLADAMAKPRPEVLEQFSANNQSYHRLAAVQLAAYGNACGFSSLEPMFVLAGCSDRELDTLIERVPVGLGNRAMGEAVAALFLVGGALGLARVFELVARLPTWRGHADSAILAGSRALCAIYGHAAHADGSPGDAQKNTDDRKPSDGRVGSKRVAHTETWVSFPGPKLLAFHLVGRQAFDTPQFFPILFDGLTDEEASRALIALAVVAAEIPIVAERLQDLLNQRIDMLVEPLLIALPIAGEPLSGAVNDDVYRAASSATSLRLVEALAAVPEEGKGDEAMVPETAVVPDPSAALVKGGSLNLADARSTAARGAELFRQRRLDEAEPHAAAAVELFRALVEDDPDTHELAYVNALSVLGRIKLAQREAEAARQHLQIAKDICAKLYRRQPDRHDLVFAAVTMELTESLNHLGQHESALETVRQSTEARQQGRDSPGKWLRLSASHRTEARHLRALKRQEEAVEAARRSLEYLARVYELDREGTLKKARADVGFYRRMAKDADLPLDEDLLARFGTIGQKEAPAKASVKVA